MEEIPNELPFWLWWTQNEGIRVLFVGLLGAIIGGGFTYLGQWQARRAAIEDRRRDQTAEDARALFKSFVRLLEDIEGADYDITHQMGKSWRKPWRAIWTGPRATTIRVQGELLADPKVRKHLSEVVQFLDNAVDISNEGRFGTKVGLRRLVLALAADGIEVLGTYLRHDPFANPHAKLFAALRKVMHDQAKWEAHEIEASDVAAEEYAAQMSEEERKKIDDWIKAIVEPADDEVQDGRSDATNSTG